MLSLTGNPSNTGVAVGRVHRLLPDELEVSHYQLPESQIESEVQRFHHAIETTEQRLDALIRHLNNSANAAREFLDTHRLLLNDHELINSTIQRIRQEQCNAEWALARQRDTIAAAFAQIEDPYIRTRIEDVEHVVLMVLQSLQQEEPDFAGRLPKRLTGLVIVAKQISPAQVAILHDRDAAGMILERGGNYAHTSILARSLGLPSITGVSRALALLHENEEVIVDGHHGAVFVMYEDSLRRYYRTRQAEHDHQLQQLQEQEPRTATTRDGRGIRLMANAERPSDIRHALKLGADGVGLMRTEHLLLEAGSSDESQQYSAYRSAIEAAAGAPITIRTLDAGADKQLPDYTLPQALSSSHCENPAMGLRAIRLCLHKPDVFRTQLRAIMRAAACGPARVLLPMVTQASEIRLVRRLMKQCQQELDAEGLRYNSQLPIGAMIEVPAAALAIHCLLPELDFISIGTNDLAQYVLAADRLDPEVGYLHDPLHPGLLNLLKMVIDAANQANKTVSLCGEIAGDPRYTRVLLGLGLTEFSMHSGSLPEVRQEIARTHAGFSEQLMHQHLKAPTMEGIQLVHHLASDSNQN
jgi:phosphotransferase system enzyme I (PtsI)